MVDLIFIYGPPAVGKLTVAKELSELTGISLFHNHLTYDLASIVYEPHTELFYDYCDTLRIDCFRRSVARNKRLIFTFCYIAPDDDAFISKVHEVFDAYNKTVQFVKLTSPKSIILDRVGNEDRSKYSKINDRDTLKNYLTNQTNYSIITHNNTVEVDTSCYTAFESATIVKQHIGE